MTFVRLLQLGTKSFRDAFDVQSKISSHILEQLRTGVAPSELNNTLILVEHNPVYTIGIRSKQYTPQLVDKLRSLGAEFVATDRGGLITFHGFGQLVVYPILYLGSFGNKSIKWYIHQLENTVIAMANSALKDKELEVSTITEYPGVWIEKERKLAAIGVHARRYVTTHGVSINCNTDLSWFEHIIPCGIEGKTVTSFSTELNRNFTVEEAIPHLLLAFKNTFGCEFK